MFSRPKQIVLYSHGKLFIVLAKLSAPDLLLGNLTLSSANIWRISLP